MTRFERYKNMTVEELAKFIIKNNICDDYCKSDCSECDDVETPDLCCPPEKKLECCVKWLLESDAWYENCKSTKIDWKWK